MKWSLVPVLVVSLSLTHGADNGVGLTPPMGWLTWMHFGCNVDCILKEFCISETMIKSMADHMVSGGYLAAGYEYIIIDDCWMAKSRDSNGRLQGDPKRFPSGMKALADYVHSKGLKFGLYEDFGNKTCAGYPGSEYHLETDAQTFAEWGVDYVKLDGCNSAPADADYGFPNMSMYLNQTGRHIFYNCKWPFNVRFLQGKQPNYAAIQKFCNSWRNFGDIESSWKGVTDVLNYYGTDADGFAEYAAPGSWNDPDMLIIGNYFKLTEDQAKGQMAMWAMMASPLIMSNDLRLISKSAADILKNTRVIKINQDPLGKQGKPIRNISGIEVWSKPITPSGSFALAFLQKGDPGNVTTIKVFGKDVGLVEVNGYKMAEAFSGTDLGIYKPDTSFTVAVKPTSVTLLTAEIQHVQRRSSVNSALKWKPQVAKSIP